MDIINSLAKNIIETTYERIPPEVVEMTKKEIMDSFAVAIAGSSAREVRALLDLHQDWGGKKESSVWVYGEQFPCVNVALINAVMIHARDFDDTHDPAIFHPAVVAVPTAFAIAERTGPIHGKDLLTAVALGVDLAARLCLACTDDYFAAGWHFTALHGTFSSTAIAGKLLGLDERTLVHAFGIAYHQAAGNLQCINDGALTKRCGPGFSNRNGIMSALMAQKGITGAHHVLQGANGLFNQYHRKLYKPERLTENLGVFFEGGKVSFKPYPCCRYGHSAIDATIYLMRKYGVKAEDVEKAVVRVGKNAYGILADPIEIKRNPRTAVDAQFSLPWAVASALVHGSVTIVDIIDEAIQNKEVLAVSNRVSAAVDADLCLPGIEPSIVELETKNGKTYSHRVNHPYGSPGNPMTLGALGEKLRMAVPYAAKPLRDDTVNDLLEAVYTLETIKDVRQIVDLLS